MSDPVDPTELAGVAEAHTESAYAWGEVDDQAADDAPTRRITPGRITGLAVAGSVIAVASASLVAWLYLGDRQPVPEAASAPAPEAPARPYPQLPADDAEFVVRMKGFGVPVSDQDPEFTVRLAHAICTPAVEKNYPPGMHSMNLFAGTMMKLNPGWTFQQATRFTEGAVAHYCPSLRGPSLKEIAALPPDQRYLALLGDQVGITPYPPGDTSLIDAAHQVCEWKSINWRDDKIVDAINSPNTRDQEMVIIESAVDVYCPEYRGR